MKIRFTYLSEINIYAIGAMVFFIAALFSSGYHHFDEHFQILEFTSLKLHIAKENDMPWEYAAKMRSALQPLFVITFYKLLSIVGPVNPFILSTFLRLLSAALAFYCTYQLIQCFGQSLSEKYRSRLLLPLSFFLWFGVYNAVRFSSENWSAMLLILSLCLLTGSTIKGYKTYLYAGLLLGGAFLLRFQTGFMILGLAIWLLFIRKERIGSLFLTAATIFAVVAAGVLIDKWFYGVWTLSCWNYFDQNILQNKVSGFGVYPWWWYLSETFLNTIPPFSLVYLLGLLIFFVLHPRHLFTFILIPFLLVHFYIGHKEIRFLFPVIYFLPLCIAFTIRAVNQKWSVPLLGQRAFKFFLPGFWLVNFVMLLVVMFKPADSYIDLYETIYNRYTAPTKLYGLNENPYHRVLDIHFYKRASLSLNLINNTSEIQAGKDSIVLLATTDRNAAEQLTQPHKLIYSGLPEWVRAFNYNRWLDRTKIWYVYEIENRN
ncbi:MAG: hypothetical protein U0T74_05015 [Chitinophagales bacterium]